MLLTIELPEALLAQVRAIADEQGTTLDRLVADALQHALSPVPDKDLQEEAWLQVMSSNPMFAFFLDDSAEDVYSREDGVQIPSCECIPTP